MTFPSIVRLEDRQLLSTDVLTQRGDVTRTGVNSTETVLTPSNVNASQFGQLYNTPVDGVVSAQPLVVTGLNVTAGSAPGVHDVVFVATENDSLYAIDSATGTTLWHDSFINAAAGITSMPSYDLTGEVSPQVGILSTPVIDTTTNTLYLIADTKEIRSGISHDVFKIHAIDLSTGAEKLGGPVTIGDTTYTGNITQTATDVINSGPSVVGTGAGSVNGQVQFDAHLELQRTALTLANGSVYAMFASHGDTGNYHGWILGFSASTLAPTAVFNVTPNGTKGGIWMAGAGLAVDSSGAMYATSGNGDFNASLHNYGDTVMKLVVDTSSTATNQNGNGWGLKVADYFTPFNQAALQSIDEDLGSGGIVLLPDSAGSAAAPHLLLTTGKEGRVYLINRDNMGGYDPAIDHVVQELTNTIDGAWSSPAFFGSTLYYATDGYSLPSNNQAKAFSIVNGQLSTTPTSQSSDTFAYPGSTPTVSANGTSSGIVWTLDKGTGELRAYDASNLATELYNSNQAAGGRDTLGAITSFVVPTVANGQVFVGTTNSLVAYGLLKVTTVPAAPTNLAATATSTSQINLTWTDNSTNETAYLVEQSTDGINFTQVASLPAGATTYSATGLQPSTTYTFRVRATNSAGNSAYSNNATATTQALVTIPAAPTNLIVTPSTTTVSLTWVDNSSNETGFLIERKLGAGNYSQIATVAANTTTFTDTGLSSGTSYTYRVRATNSVGNSAYSNEAAVTTLTNSGFNFDSGFASAGSSITYNGTAGLTSTSLTLTSGFSGYVQGSAFTTKAVPVNAFTTHFQFQLTNATAEGITFTIQGNSAKTLADSRGLGSGLGYAGIGKSIAVKFDLSNSFGEGWNSTGLYKNGASPTIPSINLGANNINLHSGDVFDVTITYDGKNLVVTIVDKTTDASARQSYTVDIPGTVGGANAYIGFTGSTGFNTANQKILNWSYQPTGAITTPWTAQDIGKPALAGSSGFTNGQFVITGGGSDIWNNADQFQYVSQPLSGDGTLVARVTSQTSSNVWAKAGLMVRATSDPGSPFVDLVQTPSSGVSFQYRSSQGGYSSLVTSVTFKNPVTLKLVRSGSLFTAYASSDGLNYTKIGAISVSMPSNVQAGLAVTSHDNAAVSTASFDNVSLTSTTTTAIPAPWTATNIGGSVPTGTATDSGGTFTLNGGGTGIRLNSDQFLFVDQMTQGDTTITAKLNSLDYTSPFAKGSVMIRATSDPGSAYVSMTQTAGSGLIMDFRSSQGGFVQTFQGPTITGPVWLKLVRRGSTFTGSYSTDGVNYTLLGSVFVSMATNTFTGLAVTSHNTTTTARGVFSNVSVTSP